MEEQKEENKDQIKFENEPKAEEQKNMNLKEEITEQKPKLSKLIFLKIISNYNKILNFLNDKEKKNLLLVTKYSASTVQSILKESNTKELQESENALNKIKSTFKEEDNSGNIPPFQLSKIGLKSLEKINEEVSPVIFASEEIPNRDIINLFRLFFQLINKDKEMINKKDDEFWKFAKDKLFTSKKGKLDEHIKEMLNQLDFSEENLYTINKNYKNCFDKIALPKYYSNLNNTVGYFSFLIKEILEYSGILYNNKKTCIQLNYKRLLYIIELIKDKNKKNEQILNKINASNK